MADDKTKRGSPDNKRLNKSEPYETKYARSKRASPQRKAMAGAGGSGKSGNGASKAASAKSGGGAAKRSSRPATKKTSAKKSSASRKSSGSGSGRSAGTRGSAKSASPAMKRTNAAPARGRTPTQRGTPNPPKEEKTIENTAPKTMREADAVDLLTDDHLEVSALFKKYEKLAKKEAGADERRELAGTICSMLRAHTQIEEEIFYPAARSAGIDPDQLDEARIEHASAKDLIAQIESGNPADDLYDARVTVLGEYIQHHVVEEHTEMFPQCRRADMDLVALRGELEARKMSILPDGGAAMAADGTGKGSDSPGLLAKLGDKLFSSDSAADKRGRASESRR
jgi:hypothetical protein